MTERSQRAATVGVGLGEDKFRDTISGTRVHTVVARSHGLRRGGEYRTDNDIGGVLVFVARPRATQFN